jgi:hypothetical protein
MDAAEFSEVLRAIGWSAGELARRLSIRPGSVYDWLNARRPIPDNLGKWLRQVRDAQGQAPPLPDDWRA